MTTLGARAPERVPALIVSPRRRNVAAMCGTTRSSHRSPRTMTVSLPHWWIVQLGTRTWFALTTPSLPMAPTATFARRSALRLRAWVCFRNMPSSSTSGLPGST
jgi:hypothetical protein